MSAESDLGELFRKTIEQFQLSPNTAMTLLQNILEILSQKT